MRTCSRAWVAMAFLAAVVGVSRADEVDPRPAILIISDSSTLPVGLGTSWAQIVAKKHPDWNIVIAADNKRTIPELDANFGDIVENPLAASFHSVLIFLGTNDAAADAFAKTDATAIAGHLRSIVAKLRKSGATAKAKIVLVTPMPVIDARLDRWNQDRFKGGEKNSDAIAEALRKVASEEKLSLSDFHKYAKEDVADGKPGKLLGTIGWQMRDWGHPIAARWFDEQIAALQPVPRDAAAFAAWHAEQAAGAKLAQILSETSEGIVAHGPALASKAANINKFGSSVITVPVEALAGKSLNIVMLPSGDKPMSAVGTGVNHRAYQPRLVVKLAGGEKPLEIAFPGGDWQLVAEWSPATPVDASLFRFNAQKMNYYGLTSSEPGQRAWMLVRVPLEKLAGQKVESAEIIVPHPAGLERFENNRGTSVAMNQLGHCTAAVVLGEDANWDDSLATWKTRDGKIGWTGGKVDATKRHAAIEAFLQDNPPAKLAEKAKAILAQTKPG